MYNIRLNFIPVMQNSYKFYLCKMSNKVLADVCTTSINEIKDNEKKHKDIYQRSLSESRVRSIEAFVKREKGIMPSSIILNSNKKLRFDNDCIVISNKDSFFIIDGQHRIYGAKSANEPYEFPVVIFDNVEMSLQSELFISINNEQKKVNPNVRYAVMASDAVKMPEKVLYNIANELNYDEQSPFFGLIRMDDRHNRLAGLSVSAFVSALISLIYMSKDYYVLKELMEKEKITDKVRVFFNNKKAINNKYRSCILWKFYSHDNEDIIYKLIYNYFDAVKTILADYWNESTILYKTTGFNALVLLLKVIAEKCIKEKNFSYNNIYKYIAGIKNTNSDYSVESCGLGKVASQNLYKSFLNAMKFDYEDIDYNLYANFEE